MELGAQVEEAGLAHGRHVDLIGEHIAVDLDVAPHLGHLLGGG
jgi:hypothetical protein